MYSQEHRNLRLISPLGEDILLLRGLQGQEAISSLFQFELEVVSFLDDIPFSDLVGEKVTIQIRMRDDSWRSINGIVSEFFQGSRDVSGLTAYRMTVVPWLWLLTLTTDCRIFQEMSVQDIVSKIFDDLGHSDYEFRGATGGSEPRIYCVQYRETSFNFISRLLEEEGIHYFWEQDEGTHTLVMTDDSSQNQPCIGHEEVPYALGSSVAHLPEDAILDLRLGQRLRSGKVALTDYNFETPSTSLMVELADQREMEIYDYPGQYDNSGGGDAYARVRLEEQVGQELRAEGESFCRGFSPGYRFDLRDFYRSSGVETSQLILSVYHEARDNIGAVTAEDDLDIGGGLHYKNRFVCQPHSTPFRPPRRALKPIVRGTQTAIVTGKSGEEIWTDSHGRVKVQFHWDREGARDEKSSCWIRVSQNWAGQGWGAIFIPRMGQEVIVDFLEGDPDRPLITGRVYNGEQVPPYTLPDDQTKSTIKSNSSKGGGGFNEFRFEDKSGEEEIWLHGQKDWNIKILNDKTQDIGHDETLTVGNDKTITVGHDRNKEVKNDQSETIGNNKTISVAVNHDESIGSDKSMSVGGSHSETIGGGKTLSVGGSHTETIASDMMVTVAASMTETVATTYTELVGGAMSVLVGGGMTLGVGGGLATTVGGGGSMSVAGSMSQNVGGDSSSSTSGSSSTTVSGDSSIAVEGAATAAIKKALAVNGDDNIAVNGKKKLSIEAADEISLKAGDASITLKKNGDIIIKGKKITIKGSGDIVMKGSKILQN